MNWWKVSAPELAEFLAADQSEHPCGPWSTAESAIKWDVSIKTEPWSNWRRSGLMNHISFYIMCTVRCMCVACQGNRWYQDALWEEGKPVEAVWCSSGKPWFLSFELTYIKGKLASSLTQMLALTVFNECIGIVHRTAAKQHIRKHTSHRSSYIQNRLVCRIDTCKDADLMTRLINYFGHTLHIIAQTLDFASFLSRNHSCSIQNHANFCTLNIHASSVQGKSLFDNRDSTLGTVPLPCAVKWT